MNGLLGKLWGMKMDKIMDKKMDNNKNKIIKINKNIN
jgi:hypothetical protein